MSDLRPVKVRFAPSPTGYLHIGGARTALFNWLFAKHFKGKFVLRIESTDKERSAPEFVEAILAGLAWLGLDFDEGPFFQHERVAIYQKVADQLVAQGKAYLSDAQGGDFPAVIFKVGKQQISFIDMLRGTITVDSATFEDLVLMKSDGMPTYNFACVVDDYLMEITHVLRGDDHISNTPKQVVLYEALGFAQPYFLHLPMILGGDGTRLSKRHNATAIEAYQLDGFLPEAVLNYLSLLGWNLGNDEEILAVLEIIDLFSTEKISKKSAVFDIEKLKWLNGQYIMKADVEYLYAHLQAFVAFDDNKERNFKIIRLLQERMKTLKDFVFLSAYFYTETISYDEEAVKKHLKKEKCIDILKVSCTMINAFSAEEFKEENLELKLRNLAEEFGVGAGKIIHPLRVAVTGRSSSPGIFEVMVLLGKNVVLRRIREVIEKLERNEI